jgi:hypothetical protein
MGLRETCNYYGGQPAPHLTPLVDKMIGTAFPTVKYVADNLPAILYVADNMEAIVRLAQAQQMQLTDLQAQIAVLNALVIPKTPTIVAPPLSLSTN